MSLQRFAIVLIAISLLGMLPPSSPAELNSSHHASAIFPQPAPRAAHPVPSFPAAPHFVDPDLKSVVGRATLLVAVDSSVPPIEIAKFFDTARILPPAGGVRFVRGTIEAAKIPELAASPGIVAILKDRPITFPAVSPKTSSAQPANPLRFGYEPSTGIERDSLRGGPEATMYQVVNFTGARRTWTELGVNGTGVTVAVVDTGVDHGAMNLGDAAVARDANGLPSSFDADGAAFGRTTMVVTSYRSGGRTFVRTGGTNPVVYIFDLAEAFGPYGPANVSWSDSRLFGTPFPADMDVTSVVPSASGQYHFGVLAEWHLILPYVYLDLFPVLVVDASSPGVYDTVYLDLSFDWFLNGFIRTPDLSFSDEPMLRPSGGPVVAARDMDGDGYPDVSAGSLAYGLDVWGLEATPSKRFRVLLPADPDGDHVVMVYDWVGHGTSVAASAAGRETAHPLAGPGIAPGARIMGIPVFFWGDILEAWLWAAGFDLVDLATPTDVPGHFLLARHGTWTYTGNHKADVISNSWGFSDWLVFPYFFGWPWYDILTVLEDALMTPGYLDPSYPGTLMVHAGGNGGAGYGTVTEPGFSSLALTVGASTSLNDTSLPFGGFHDDVMSWSARGPTPLGAPKPDVVMVGAFAYTSAPPWSGNGSGVSAYTLFGGTSLATPATSGAAAVAIQAYLQAHGQRPSPFVTKAILKSTALDLGYDAFAQGAGHVNVYNAASFANGRRGILVTSTASWESTRTRLVEPWATGSAFYGPQLGGAPPPGPIPDTSWFAGAVRPGETAATAFNVTAAGASSGTPIAAWHVRTGILTRTGTTRNLGSGWLEGYGELVPLASTDVPASTDLMVVRASIPYRYFDSNYDYIWDNRVRIVVGDWVDADRDGVATPDEVRVFNYGYNTGTAVEARVGLPQGRFSGRPILWFSQVPGAGRTFVAIPFTIQIEFYQRVPWPWISVPAGFFAPGTITATLTVPPDADPGIYEGQILVAPTGGNRTAVPVSVVVPRVLDRSTLTASLSSAGSGAIYDSSKVGGYFDWRWRSEAGDWRFWNVQVDDPDVVAMRVNASWTDLDTDVDLWSMTPSGVPGDSSFSPNLGNGTFRWDTRTGRSEDFVIVDVQSSLDQPGPGLYTFALHNVLFGSNPAPEPLSGSVSVAKLSPRGPLTVFARPGATVPVRFVLTTGFSLSRVAWIESPPPIGSTFPAATWPSSIPFIGRGESRELWANFTVPANTSDGSYENFLVLGSNELFFGEIVRVDIVVDSAAPLVSILGPAAGEFVGGSVTVRAGVEDANGIRSVTFNAGAASGSLAKEGPTGTWSGVWDTTSSPDGPETIRVSATDSAGNTRLASLDVVVDNTVPVVRITSPASGAGVTGATTIAWSLTEANPDRLVLVIDGASRDVTGNASYPWDTTRFADGPHTIEVRAIDKAGNEAGATATVTVNNQGAGATGSLLTGLAIGLVIAAVVGFAVGFLVGRRRRPPQPPPAPPPDASSGAGGPNQIGGKP